MRYAIIENGKVVNVALADEPLTPAWIASDTARIGDDYVDGEFTPPAPDYDAQWAAVRAERNARLAATDWWVMKAAETGGIIRDAQRAYRQALRDITAQPDPFNITWPAEPGA
jgi:hypothetical protein